MVPTLSLSESSVMLAENCAESAITLMPQIRQTSRSSHGAPPYRKPTMTAQPPETVMAAKDGDPQKLVYEVADLWFHSLVALAHFGLKPEDVLAELARREGLSGLAEFAARPKT